MPLALRSRGTSPGRGLNTNGDSVDWAYPIAARATALSMRAPMASGKGAMPTC